MPKHRACTACRGTATAWVIGKENVSSEINISGLECGRVVRDRIAPAIYDVLSPAAGSEKANAPHQSAPVNRKREDWLHVPEFHGLQSPLSSYEIHRGVEIAGEVAKRPGDQGKIRAV